MTEPPAISIRFAPEADAVVRRRMDYAFRVFCATYGFRAVPEGGDARLCYGVPAETPHDVALGAGYRARAHTAAADAPRIARSGVSAFGGLEPVAYPMFHPAAGDSPDWLGDAFEWLSAAHEQSVRERDGIGRIPARCTLPGAFGLDPCVPYAGLAFRGLNERLAAATGDGWPRSPSSPFGGGERALVIACTHDVDYIPAGALDACGRVLKNIAIALAHHRDPGCALGIAARAAAGALRGRMPFDHLLRMVRRERELGIGSTCTVLCRQAHRRDANYRPDQPPVRRLLGRLAREGVELGVHGSYESLRIRDGLAGEYDALAQLTGVRPAGGRQHWLRFSGTGLFEELCRSGALYDCTVGFSEHAGYRTGASFPYPPYDFAAERAFPIIEFPLVMMDVALYAATRDSGGAERTCERVLRWGRGTSWGGMSLLWHDTVLSGLQIPPAFAELFWRLKQPSDRWVGCAELAGRVRPRFAAAGLDLPPPGPAASAGAAG